VQAREVVLVRKLGGSRESQSVDRQQSISSYASDGSFSEPEVGGYRRRGVIMILKAKLTEWQRDILQSREPRLTAKYLIKTLI